MQYKESIHAIKQACRFISVGQIDEAAHHIGEHYPFKPLEKSARKYTPLQNLPAIFPYHKNGKMSVGHIAYWQLFPTIDHIYPVARGGKDEETNWVCCSMLSNSIKSNWTLEELEWELLPPGNRADWDGMLGWYIEQVEANNTFLSKQYFKIWYNAAKACSTI